MFEIYKKHYIYLSRVCLLAALRAAFEARRRPLTLVRGGVGGGGKAMGR